MLAGFLWKNSGSWLIRTGWQRMADGMDYSPGCSMTGSCGGQWWPRVAAQRVAGWGGRALVDTVRGHRGSGGLVLGRYSGRRRNVETMGSRAHQQRPFCWQSTHKWVTIANHDAIVS